MKALRHQSRPGSLLAGLLALIGLACFVAAAQGAGNTVTITGHLHADDRSMEDAVVVVELGDDACLRSELTANGRFEFRVPVGAKARLVFVKPGYLTKEVELDTRNAMNTDRARKLNKEVRFDVVLEEALEHVNEMYLGPVGYIHFVNGTGLMRVRHDERMKPVAVISEQDPIASY